MGDIVGFPSENKRDTVDVGRRDAAVDQVRTLILKILAAECEACRFAMDLGDFLTLLKDSVGRGRWLPFLQDCGIHPRSAQNYMLLAANRAVIEATNTNRYSYLSIAEALRLVRPKKPKPEPGKVSQGKSDTVITIAMVLAWLKTASTTEKLEIMTTLAKDATFTRGDIASRYFKMVVELVRPDDALVVH
jgi:hypothetical protein